MSTSPVDLANRYALRDIWASLVSVTNASVVVAIGCLVALYLLGTKEVLGTDVLAGLIVFIAASISSIAGFAFSPLAGSMLFHVTNDSIYTVQIMLVASIAIQAYSVWMLRNSIVFSRVIPYFAGGMLTVLPGVLLLLHTPLQVYLLALGAFLTAYAFYMLLRQPYRLKSDYLLGRIAVGALGGITGATAAFPGAFVTIWCGAHGWDKQHQRAIYQPYILGMQVLALIALAAFKPWQATRPELIYYIFSSMLGACIGWNIFNRLSTGQFNRIVSTFLLLSGIVLMLKVL